MTTKQHYDNHLGEVYSWMVGDSTKKVTEFANFLVDNKLNEGKSKLAIDLGAGNGIQSIALARAGYKTVAVDFCQLLLDELNHNKNELEIDIINYDILKYSSLINNASLIVCWGDTLTHLSTIGDVVTLLNNSIRGLNQNGTLILSFRDYSINTPGDNVKIDVKTSFDLKLQCLLEYKTKKVTVTDIINKKEGNNWVQSKSTYNKTIISPQFVTDILRNAGLNVDKSTLANGMVCIIATKQ